MLNFEVTSDYVKGAIYKYVKGGSKELCTKDRIGKGGFMCNLNIGIKIRCLCNNINFYFEQFPTVSSIYHRYNTTPRSLNKSFSQGVEQSSINMSPAGCWCCWSQEEGHESWFSS